MRKVMVGCSVASTVVFAGCNFRVVDGSSNQPDSGVACLNGAGPGTASLTGPASFVVQTAYEKRQSLVALDGGAIDTAWLTFGLYSQAQGCGVPGVDAGDARPPLLVAYLFDSADHYGAAEYPVVQLDGGQRRALVYLATLDGGAVATGGSVQITTVAPCSLSGNLAVTFGSEDAGTLTSLEGTFSPTYCE